MIFFHKIKNANAPVACLLSPFALFNRDKDLCETILSIFSASPARLLVFVNTYQFTLEKSQFKICNVQSPRLIRDTLQRVMDILYRHLQHLSNLLKVIPRIPAFENFQFAGVKNFLNSTKSKYLSIRFCIRPRCGIQSATRPSNLAASFSDIDPIGMSQRRDCRSLTLTILCQEIFLIFHPRVLYQTNVLILKASLEI